MSDYESLLRHPELWRACDLGTRNNDSHANGISTGYDDLDDVLCDGGWPRDGLTELLCDTHGVGELRLLVPALARLSQDEVRWIAWVNPPFVPYAPALASVGIDVSKVLLIHPKNHTEALWALELALKTGTCSAALAWLNEPELKFKELRRLQLAAKAGGTWANLFRPESAARQPSMAELRLKVLYVEDPVQDPVKDPLKDQAKSKANRNLSDVPDVESAKAESRAGETPRQLSLSILKRRGGWPIPNIDLDHAPLDPVDNAPPGVRDQVADQVALWRRLQSSVASAENKRQTRGKHALVRRSLPAAGFGDFPAPSA
ncbi:MAG: translesion DNA synthesis-associated protein ImuA [Gammaproteobacteria bacterium]|nr:translesion DNA synthesis-associated protein ImuA [Gammaproteobacteria bacterium]